MKNVMQTQPKITERLRTIKSSGVVMAPRLKKTSEMIDSDGNVIDPITKQIIKRNS